MKEINPTSTPTPTDYRVPSASCSLGGSYDSARLSDRELYQLCQTYGNNAKLWAKRFASLLPEVERRGLYRRYGFYSIYEFGAKLGGLSRKTVEEVLRTYRKVEDKPLLKAEIEKEGWAKVRVVSSIATDENEETLVELVKTLPKSALEVYVREFKEQQSTEGGFDLNDPPGWVSQPVMNDFKTLSFRIDRETEFRLRRFKQKLEKERKEPVSFNEVLKALLDQVDQVENQGKSTKTIRWNGSEGGEEGEEKEKSTRTIQQNWSEGGKERTNQRTNQKSVTRYLPVVIRRGLEEKHRGRCGFSGCNKPYTIYHHPKRFALTRNHDYLVPLCKEHHQIAHFGLIRYEEEQPIEWRVGEKPNRETLTYVIDQRVQMSQLKGSSCS